MLAEAIEVALRAARLTDGDVDPALGAALVLCGYDRDWELMGSARRERASAARTLPSTIRAHVRGGWQTIEFDRDLRMVRVPRGVELDLGATAKAWAADRAARAVHEATGSGVLVSLGGDIATAGGGPPGGWRIHVTDDHRARPDAPGQTLTIADGGLATSSVAVRRWVHRGAPMHHIIDPRSGAPVHAVWRTVSVAAGDCTDANIASTAAIVRGAEAPAWLAARSLPARLVAPNGEVQTVAGWPHGGPRGAGRGVSSMLAVGGGPSAYWYLTRSTGAVALVLLTVSLALGVADVRRYATARWPRFVIDGLHRNVSLLAVVFVVLHVLTSVLDGFAPISLTAAVIPFISSYRPIWLGLGALSFDLLLALIFTSLLRARVSHRAWRITHWTAYACWPIALIHSFGTGSDARSAWLLLLSVGCVLIVALAILSRALPDFRAHPRLNGAALGGAAAFALFLVIWLPSGPLAKDWARRAGTPGSLLGHTQSSGATSGSAATHGPCGRGGRTLSALAYAPTASLPRLLQGVPPAGAMSFEEHLATHGEIPGVAARLASRRPGADRGARAGGTARTRRRRLSDRREDARGRERARRAGAKRLLGAPDRGRQRRRGRTGEREGPHAARSASAPRARRRRGGGRRGGRRRGRGVRVRERRGGAREPHARHPRAQSAEGPRRPAGTSRGCPSATSPARSPRS